MALWAFAFPILSVWGKILIVAANISAAILLTAQAATEDLTLTSAGQTYQCSVLHTDTMLKYYRCQGSRESDPIYLTEVEKYGASEFAAFGLNGVVPVEVPVHAIRRGDEILRETPGHIIVNDRSTVPQRVQFNTLLGAKFFSADLPEQLQPFLNFVNSEKQALAQIENCSEVQVKTAGSPSRTLNCRRGGADPLSLTCNLFNCLQSNGESILLSYDQLLSASSVPQLWSLRNGSPSTFMHVQEARCGDSLLMQRDAESINPNYLPFYFEGGNILVENSPYDPLSILQRYDFNAHYVLEQNSTFCNSPEIARHVQQEQDFRRRHSTEITRDVLATTVERVNGVLERTIQRVSNIGDNFCRLQPGVYVELEIAGRSNQLDLLQQEFLIDTPAQTINPAQLRTVFGEISILPSMAYNYPLDGCYARAHIIHDYIRRNRNLDCKKIWLSGNYLRPRAAPSVRWTYHVAVACPTEQTDGSVKYMVIDPTTNPEPVTQEAWFASMEVSSPLATGNEIIDDRSIFTYSISDGDRYQPHSPAGTYESYLDEAHEILEYYENSTY